MGIFNTLHNSREFKKVYDDGISKADRNLVMFVLRKDTPGLRVGISVSKKVGNSVVRHRIKRLVKESLRLRLNSFGDNVDIAFIVRMGAREAGFHDIDRSVERLGKKLGIIVDNSSEHI